MYAIKRKRNNENNEENEINESSSTSISDTNTISRKKRGRKQIFKYPKIIDPSIYNNKTIQDAKKQNKEDKNNRRLGEDIQYDEEINESEIKKKNPNTLHDIFKAIVMLKNNKEYNLYEALNNTNANISFAQLFAVSPSLRKLCSKGLKLNNEDLRYINMIQNFDIEDSDMSTVDETINELDYALKNNTLQFVKAPEKPINQLYSVNKSNIATVLGFVDNISSKILIDTGSGVNVIKKSFYNKISKNHNAILKEKTYFKLASNAVVSADHVVFLCLEFDKLKINSMFWILDDTDECYDIILGRNSQKENRLYIDPDDDGLYMKRDGKTSLCVAAPVSVPSHQRVIFYISLAAKISDNIKSDNSIIPNPSPLNNLLDSFNDIYINPIEEEKLPSISLDDIGEKYIAINLINNTIYSDLNEEKRIASLKDILNNDKKLQILLKNFDDVLIDSIDRVRTANAEPHSISLTNSKPIKLRPYKISLEQSLALKKEIKKLLDHGLIVPSRSPWAFPVLLVKKKNGEWRMCVDYRKLNEITIKDAYALPFIDELLESVHGAKIFSALDLFSGYHQIPMDPKDVEKTAFTTKFGNYNFVVMPFGLTNAPASFQREMNRILIPLIGKCLFVYMDDILVYSPTFEQHLKDLESVFQILRKYKFSVNITKCKFCQKSVEVLGHVLSDEGIKPIPSKVFAISS